MGAIHANNFTEQLFKHLMKGTYLRVDEAAEYSDDKTEVTYRLFDSKEFKELVKFRARPMPGCCGVLVVYYLRPTDGKNVSLFKDTLEMILQAAGNAKYGQVLMTQTAKSLGSHALEGWACTETPSTNWKTNNKVVLYSFLTVKPEEAKKEPTFDTEWD